MTAGLRLAVLWGALFLWPPGLLQAQEEILLLPEKLPESTADSLRTIPLPDSAVLDTQRYLREVQHFMLGEAYPNPQVKRKGDRLELIPGKRRFMGEWSLVVTDSSAPEPAGQISYQPLQQKNWDNYVEGLLTFYENRGYPFVRLVPTDYQLLRDTLKGKLRVEAGPYISFDSLVLRGEEKLAPGVIRHLLGYRAGKPYSEKWLAQLPRRIAQLPYVKNKRPPAVAFIRDRTTLYLSLDKARANQIDGVVGLNTEPDGNTTINGDFTLGLANTFHQGEQLNLRWRRPDASVQELLVQLEWPFLFRSPVWLQTELEIFRQDSSFVNTDWNSTAKYQLAPGQFVTGGVDLRQSNVLNEEVAPANLTSLQRNRWRVGLELQDLNRALLPTQGYRLEASGFSATRNVDSSSSNQWGWELTAEHFWPWTPRMLLRSRILSSGLAGEGLFRNELYRLGGLQTLRGFNEQSFFSSTYALATLEYRYLIGSYDYLSVFADGGYLEEDSQERFRRNWVLGLGTGLSFRTSGGIFSLFLAIGRTDESSFDFRATKVHFGYISQF